MAKSRTVEFCYSSRLNDQQNSRLLDQNMKDPKSPDRRAYGWDGTKLEVENYT
jgi:hypothetical protein